MTKSLMHSYRFELDFEQMFSSTPISTINPDDNQDKNKNKSNHSSPSRASQENGNEDEDDPIDIYSIAEKIQVMIGSSNQNDNDDNDDNERVQHAVVETLGQLPHLIILHICSYLLIGDVCDDNHQENDFNIENSSQIFVHSLKLLNSNWNRALSMFQWTDTEEIYWFNQDKTLHNHHSDVALSIQEKREQASIDCDRGDELDRKRTNSLKNEHLIDGNNENVDAQLKNEHVNDSETSPSKKPRMEGWSNSESSSQKLSNRYSIMSNRSFLRRYSIRQKQNNRQSSHKSNDVSTVIDLTMDNGSVDDNNDMTNDIESDPDIVIMSDNENEGNVNESHLNVSDHEIEEEDEIVLSEVEHEEGRDNDDRDDDGVNELNSKHSDTITPSIGIINIDDMDHETQAIENDAPDTTPQKQKLENVESQNKDNQQLRQIRSSITILRFNKEFEIELTDPFWLLRIIDSKSEYVLDPSKPIFSVNNFLKIVRFYQNNPSKLVCSKIDSLHGLVLRLKPFTSIFFSSEREVEYFISQIDEILYPSENSLLKLGNLSFLVMQYIQHYKHWFEDKPDQFPNCFRQAGRYECKDSGAQMKRMLDCAPDETKSLNFNMEQFPIHDEMFSYLHSDIINACIDTLSIQSFSYEDGTFNGDINNRTSLPEGYGSWVSSDNTARYDGYWVNGEKCGEGTYTSEHFKYHGEWMHNLFHGEGELLFTGGDHSGSVYRGQFSHGAKHGFGIQCYKQLHHSSSERDMVRYGEDDKKLYDAWYRGSWKKDQRWGTGEYRTNGAWRYGIWRRDELYDGIGLVLDSNDNMNYAITVEGFHTTSRKCVVPKNFLTSMMDDDGDSQQNKYDLDSAMDQYLNGTVTSPLIAPKRVLWAGYCFRSRLEARWALFLEYLKIDYVYEPRTFHLPNGHKYTPDFYLPYRKVWFEIKPTYPTEEERERAQLLAKESSIKGHRVFLIYGSAYPPFIRKHYEGAKAIEFMENGQQIEPMAWTQCKQCSKIDLGLRCQPQCHPASHDGSVEPSPLLTLAFEYVNKIDFDQLTKAQMELQSPQHFPNQNGGGDTKASRYFCL